MSIGFPTNTVVMYSLYQMVSGRVGKMEPAKEEPVRTPAFRR